MQLAAGGFRQGAGIEQHHHARRLLIVFGHGLADGLDQGLRRQDLAHAAADFGGDADALLALFGDRKRRHPTFAHHLHFPLDGLFDVLGIQVVTAHDQHVLQAPGDIQLAVAQETQVAGAQPGRPGVLDKGLGRGFGVAPVAQGDTRPGGPDLTDLVVGQHLQGVRFDHLHGMPGLAGATTHHRVAVARLRAILRQRQIIQAQRGNTPATLATGDKQGGFRQAVGRKPGIGAETARRELLGETLQGVEADRLGTGIGDAPAAQVQARQRAVTDPLAAQPIGEVRAAADGAAVFADRFQPAQRASEEIGRRHQYTGHAAEDRLQQPADQAHVVVERQPADDDVIGIEIDTKTAADQQFVGHQVAVADLHALGQRGGTRGVLQEGDIVGVQFRLTPVGGQRAVQLIDTEQARGIGGGQLAHLQQRFAQGLLGQDQARLGIGDDRQQAFLMVTTGGLRRIGRHRDHAGVQAAEERRDVVRAAGKQQDRAIPDLGPRLQGCRNGPRPQVQVAVTEHRALFLVLGEKTQGQPLRRLRRATLKGLGQGAGEVERIHHGIPA